MHAVLEQIVGQRLLVITAVVVGQHDVQIGDRRQGVAPTHQLAIHPRVMRQAHRFHGQCNAVEHDNVGARNVPSFVIQAVLEQ